ncbi:MAG TPA: hypothetical protein VK622_00570 [Puia sp.]|nr:hypothetical protein [Puia sp.]
MVDYQINKIGLLPGGTYSIANGINNKGEVAGNADRPLTRDPQYPTQVAVFYSHSTGLIEINTPNANFSEFGVGLDINDSSQVVGYIEEDFYGPFIWSAATGIWSLYFGYCSAAAINNQGVIVGSQMQGVDPQAACVWDGPQQTFRLLELWTVPDTSEATGVNDQGIIVGWKQPVGGQPAAFIVYPGGGLQPVAAFQEPGSKAYGIGNGGHVVGESINAGVTRAYMWTQAGGLVYLDTLGGISSWATDVNTAGSAVGTVVMPDGNPRAFLYENGVMNDLNTLIPPGSGWQLEDAVAINDNGQIAGNGQFNGARMGFVLNPLSKFFVPKQIIEVLKHIIRYRRLPIWPFGWPFPDPEPGPARWKEVYPQGNDPMILAAMTSLVSELDDEDMRKQLDHLLIPWLKKELERLENEK